MPGRALIAMTLMAALYGCEQTTPEQQVTWVIPIEGMHCDSCASTLSRMARACDGVSQATASFKDGQLTVVMAQDAPLTPINAMIERLQYT